MVRVPPKEAMPSFMKKKDEKPNPRVEARKGAAAKRLAELKARKKGK